MTNRQTRFDIPLPESGDSTRDRLRGAVWLDIETTGLVPARSHVTLIGYLRAENRSRHLTQLFADEPNEEPEMLARAYADLGQAPLLITYNGRRFDLPFLRHRSVVVASGGGVLGER